jgi:hypothetical protein
MALHLATEPIRLLVLVDGDIGHLRITYAATVLRRSTP